MGGPTPYQPIEMDDQQQMAAGREHAGNPFARANNKTNAAPISVNADQMKRARILCDYDAKDHTELTLSANEVRHFFFISDNKEMALFTVLGKWYCSIAGFGILQMLKCLTSCTGL